MKKNVSSDLKFCIFKRLSHFLIFILICYLALFQTSINFRDSMILPNISRSFAFSATRIVSSPDYRNGKSVQNYLLQINESLSSLPQNPKFYELKSLDDIIESFFDFLIANELPLTDTNKRDLEDIITEHSKGKNIINYMRILDQVGIIDLYAYSEGPGLIYEKILSSPFSKKYSKEILRRFLSDTGYDLNKYLIHKQQNYHLLHGTTVGRQGVRAMRTGIRLNALPLDRFARTVSSGAYAGPAIYASSVDVPTVAFQWGNESETPDVFLRAIEMKILTGDSVDILVEAGPDSKFKDVTGYRVVMAEFLKWVITNSEKLSREVHPEIRHIVDPEITTKVLDEDNFDRMFGIYKIYQLAGIDIAYGKIQDDSDSNLYEWRIYNPAVVHSKRLVNIKMETIPIESSVSLVQQLKSALMSFNRDSMIDLIGKNNLSARLVRAVVDNVAPKEGAELENWRDQISKMFKRWNYDSNYIQEHTRDLEGILLSKSFSPRSFSLLSIIQEPEGTKYVPHDYGVSFLYITQQLILRFNPTNDQIKNLKEKKASRSVNEAIDDALRQEN